MSIETVAAITTICSIVLGGEATIIIYIMNQFSKLGNRLTIIETVLKIDYDTISDIPEKRREKINA